MGERTEYHKMYMQKRRQETSQRGYDNKSNEIAKEKMRDIKQRAIAYKGGKCEICGGEFHAASFDFHHENPHEKGHNISTLISTHAEWDLLKAELDKCLLICSNCHRVLHYDKPQMRKKRTVQLPDPHFWTIAELHEKTGISQRMLSRYCENGKVKAVKQGRKWVIWKNENFYTFFTPESKPSTDTHKG